VFVVFPLANANESRVSARNPEKYFPNSTPKPGKGELPPLA